jgi:hypothetical protein
MKRWQLSPAVCADRIGEPELRPPAVPDDPRRCVELCRECLAPDAGAVDRGAAREGGHGATADDGHDRRDRPTSHRRQQHGGGDRQQHTQEQATTAADGPAPPRTPDDGSHRWHSARRLPVACRLVPRGEFTGRSERSAGPNEFRPPTRRGARECTESGTTVSWGTVTVGRIEPVSRRGAAASGPLSRCVSFVSLCSLARFFVPSLAFVLTGCLAGQSTTCETKKADASRSSTPTRSERRPTPRRRHTHEHDGRPHHDMSGTRMGPVGGHVAVVCSQCSCVLPLPLLGVGQDEASHAGPSAH